MKLGRCFWGRRREYCGFTESPVKPQKFCSLCSPRPAVALKEVKVRRRMCLCLLRRCAASYWGGEQVVVAVFLISFLLFPSLGSAQTHFELTPSIYTSETYDDNIFLTNTNKVSDYITAVTPGIAMRLLREHTNFQLSYAPSFVWYADRADQDTTRHSAGLTFGQDLAERLRFDLTDTYLQSDDPLQDVQDVQGIRRTRNQYWTNSGMGNLSYIFGTENKLNVGYGGNYIKNNEVTLDNSEVQTPYANLAYWFDVKNGMELTYTYTDAHFWREDNLPASNDYTAHAPGIQYIRRFTPNAKAYIGYNYATYDFAGHLQQNFSVHGGNVGLEYSFSPEYTVAASVGYFIRVNEITKNQDGPTYSASLTRRFARGNITVGGDGGWTYQNLQQGVGLTTGFSQYYDGYVNGAYQVLERVNVYAGASYRYDKYTLTNSDFFRGNCGLRWDFLRYFYLALDYAYSQYNQDLGVGQYTDNRVSLTLGASKLYRW
jgi:hypothetical protein